jgi:hypothetical protein
MTLQFIDVQFRVCMRCGCVVSTEADDADDGGGGCRCGGGGGAEIAVVGIGFEDEETVISVCPIDKKKMGQSWAEVRLPAHARLMMERMGYKE